MNLREARLKRGKTLKEVAADVSTDVANLSRIERGQMPDRDLAVRLVEYYGGEVGFEAFFRPKSTAAEAA